MNCLFPCLQVLVGNKCDMDESKRKVPFSRGQALADEFGIRFFETSAKTNSNVEDVRPSPLPTLLLAVSCSMDRFNLACVPLPGARPVLPAIDWALGVNDSWGIPTAAQGEGRLETAMCVVVPVWWIFEGMSGTGAVV